MPDVECIRRRALKPGPLNILLVGNVIHRKGLHVLIQALMQLAPEDFRLTVAGRLDMEPGYVAYIENLIRASGLRGRVSLKGVVRGRILADLYEQHDLMVLPSAYESFGIVYVEAQQFGLPVIGTTAGAAREIIRHGDNGYLVEPADADGLADHLQTLQRDRQLLLVMSENALAAYPAYACWDDSCRVIRQYLLGYGRREDDGA
nr:glycosyltransferase family 4 protein [Methylomonas sp. SURF-2]